MLNADLCVSSFNAFIRHLVYQKEAELEHPFHNIQHFDMIRFADRRIILWTGTEWTGTESKVAIQITHILVRKEMYTILMILQD